MPPRRSLRHVCEKCSREEGAASEHWGLKHDRQYIQEGDLQGPTVETSFLCNATAIQNGATDKIHNELPKLSAQEISADFRGLVLGCLAKQIVVIYSAATSTQASRIEEAIAAKSA